MKKQSEKGKDKGKVVAPAAAAPTRSVAEDRRRSDVSPPGAQREEGVVESVHADKGFAFLRAEDGGGDDGSGTVRFFHRSAYSGRLDALHPGQRVSFIATQGSKGPRAILVQKVASEADEEIVGGGNA